MFDKVNPDDFKTLKKAKNWQFSERSARTAILIFRS